MRGGPSRRAARSWGALTVVASLGVAPSLAVAQETPGEVLFREGREALARNELEVACTKFRDSHALEKALGPLLNLANCEEKRGRRADALGLWRGIAVSSAVGSEERRVADERIAALLPTVGQLVLRLAPGAPAGATVELDGKTIALGPAPIAVDAGAHTAIARSGALEDRRSIQIAAGETKTLELRLAARTPDAPPPPPVTGSAGPTAGWIAGWVTGGVGVASLAGFAATGGIILTKSGEWGDASCDQAYDPVVCDPIKPSAGLWAANGVLLGVGLAGVGVGIILVVTQDSGGSSKPAPVSLRPGPGDAGIAIESTF